MSRKTLRRIRKSRTLRFAALLPVLVAGLETALALLPELNESLGPVLRVCMTVVVSMVLAHLRALTTKPLDAYDKDSLQ